MATASREACRRTSARVPGLVRSCIQPHDLNCQAVEACRQANPEALSCGVTVAPSLLPARPLDTRLLSDDEFAFILFHPYAPGPAGSGDKGSWRVRVTGHSLGGALATLAAYELAERR
jgi:hypothetical protein